MESVENTKFSGFRLDPILMTFAKSTQNAARQYPASRGFFLAWLLALAKSFEWLVSRVVGCSSSKFIKSPASGSSNLIYNNWKSNKNDL